MPPPPQPAVRTARAWLGLADLVAAAAVAASAGLAEVLLPGGSWMRVVLACALLFFVPGYLLIEAVAGPALGLAARLARSAFSIGISPPIVGVLALSTALAPHGFRPAAIAACITLASLLLAGVAGWRRKTATPASAAGSAAATA